MSVCQREHCDQEMAELRAEVSEAVRRAVVAEAECIRLRAELQKAAEALALACDAVALLDRECNQ